MILLLIFISIYLGLSLRWYIVFVSILVVPFFVFLFIRFKKRIFVTSLISFLIGVGVSYINFDITKESYLGVVTESKDNYYIVSSNLMKFYVYNKDNQYEVGDVLRIKGEKKDLDFVMIESSFDFKTYLNKKGVNYELSSSSVEVKYLNPIRLKSIKSKALENVNKDDALLISAIIFSDLDEGEMTDELKALHLVRLLSTSGIYIALFYKLLLGINSLFFKEKVARLISTSFIVFYAFLLYPKFSVLRFASFLILRLINEYILKGKLKFLSLLSISGLFFIIIDYHITYQISFLLGYSIPLFSYFVLQASKRYSSIIRRLISCLFIYLFLIPVDIYFYNEFSIFGYLYQLFLIPLFMLISILSILLLFKVPISPVLNHVINGVININHIYSFININLYAKPFNQVYLAIYIILLIIILYLLQIKLKPLLIFVNITYFSLLSIYFIPIKNFVSSEVSFINVGQGDSCLIRKGTTTILIDTGGSIYKDLAKESLIPYLKKKQIYNIDLLITTHDDFDHNGAKDSLIKNFKVKEYVYDASNFPITKGDITLINYNVYQSLSSDDNFDSLVIGFNLHNVDYLITGDPPKEVENYIMKDNKYIGCDILKVGHHGSKTSSSEEFIKYLNPKEAIISCGKNNKYHHPHKEVLNILKKNNVKIHRTDTEGTITYQYYY